MWVASGEPGSSAEAGGDPGPTGKSISKGRDVSGAGVSTYERAGTGGT